MSTDLDTRVTGFIHSVLGAMGLHLAADQEETADNVRINLSGDGAGGSPLPSGFGAGVRVVTLRMVRSKAALTDE